MQRTILFKEMLILSAWIIVVLVLSNNNFQVNMSLNWDRTQQISVLTPYCWILWGEAAYTNFMVFGWSDWWWNRQSHVLRMGLVTITLQWQWYWRITNEKDFIEADYQALPNYFYNVRLYRSWVITKLSPITFIM
jgi:hypothetical protein